MASRTVIIDGPFDLGLTLAPFRRGPGDPTMRLGTDRAWRATRTPDGPATLAIAVDASQVVAEAWGPGAERALHDVPALLGLDRERVPVAPAHRVVSDLDRRYARVRHGRTGAVVEALVPAILEQRVTGVEAFRSFRAIDRAHGEPAPGTPELGILLPPLPEVLAALPYHAYHPLGVERRRADLIRRVAGRAAWFEAIVDLPLPEAYARLTALPGLGPWTAAEVAVRALGDPDAVSVGDYHLPHLVTYVLAGEPRGTDARMLELLEPYRGHRARVMRLLELSGLGPPRRGPRGPLRRIEGI